jgi:pyrroline-5-carboxylate reductase
MLEGKKVGFIGAGMMAEAIVKGLLKAGLDPKSVMVSDPDEQRRKVFHEHLGVTADASNISVVQFSDILVLAVKPHVVAGVLDEIKQFLEADQLLISIAAGVTTESIEARIEKNLPVIRVMPNTPCLIGQGISALAMGRHAEPHHLDVALQIFKAVGKAIQVTEDKMDAVTGLSGSGPAYVYMLIEALADGGVRMGLPKSSALILAAQTVAGSAMMVLETGEHPAVLRDRVMTPGGTTIAGVAALEKSEFRSALIEAVTAAANRSAELGKKDVSS